MKKPAGFVLPNAVCMIMTIANAVQKRAGDANRPAMNIMGNNKWLNP
nr:hypothetical protein [Cnuella takakiae]